MALFVFLLFWGSWSTQFHRRDKPLTQMNWREGMSKLGRSLNYSTLFKLMLVTIWYVTVRVSLGMVVIRLFCKNRVRVCEFPAVFPRSHLPLDFLCFSLISEWILFRASSLCSLDVPFTWETSTDWFFRYVRKIHDSGGTPIRYTVCCFSITVADFLRSRFCSLGPNN